MAKKIIDIVHEEYRPESTSSNYTTGSTCPWGGRFTESGFEVEEITDEQYDIMYAQMLEQARKNDKDKPDLSAETLDVVAGFDASNQEWVEGIVLDVTTEFGQTVYCIEPFESTQPFTTNRIKRLDTPLDIVDAEEISDEDAAFYAAADEECPFEDFVD